MSARNGIISGLSVLAFVALAFVLYTIKSMAQVAVINNASIACSNEAKAHPGDRNTMDRCLKARGALVEDSAPPGSGRPVAAPASGPASYEDCLKTPAVVKYKPKTSSWAAALSTCVDSYGGVGVVTMQRNPSTGEIEYGVSH